MVFGKRKRADQNSDNILSAIYSGSEDLGEVKPVVIKKRGRGRPKKILQSPSVAKITSKDKDKSKQVDDTRVAKQVKKPGRPKKNPVINEAVAKETLKKESTRGRKPRRVSTPKLELSTYYVEESTDVDASSSKRAPRKELLSPGKSLASPAKSTSSRKSQRVATPEMNSPRARAKKAVQIVYPLSPIRKTPKSTTKSPIVDASRSKDSNRNRSITRSREPSPIYHLGPREGSLFYHLVREERSISRSPERRPVGKSPSRSPQRPASQNRSISRSPERRPTGTSPSRSPQRLASQDRSISRSPERRPVGKSPSRSPQRLASQERSISRSPPPRRISQQTQTFEDSGDEEKGSDQDLNVSPIRRRPRNLPSQPLPPSSTPHTPAIRVPRKPYTQRPMTQKEDIILLYGLLSCGPKFQIIKDMFFSHSDYDHINWMKLRNRASNMMGVNFQIMMRHKNFLTRSNAVEVQLWYDIHHHLRVLKNVDKNGIELTANQRNWARIPKEDHILRE